MFPLTKKKLIKHKYMLFDLFYGIKNIVFYNTLDENRLNIDGVPNLSSGIFTSGASYCKR